MKRLVSLAAALMIMLSALTAIPAEISADGGITEYGALSITKYLQTVTGDPRFDGYMSIPATAKKTRIQTFVNGSNTNKSINLSGKIDDTSEENTSVVSFYVKLPAAADLKLSFFHTRSGVVRESKGITVSVKKPNVWQAVTVPIKSFTYNAAGSDLSFGRFDIQYAAGLFSGDDTLYISKIRLLSAPDTEYGEADGIHFESDTLNLKKGEYKTVTPIFTSSSGGTAIPAEVEWSSSDEGIAAVNENGRITALADGTAVICCKMSDSVYAEIKVTVSGELVSEEVASFYIEDASVNVENDPRFKRIITPVITSATKRISFRKNGKNDNSHADLSKYIGASPIESMAVAAFYIKTSYSGELGACFFHTKSGEYKDSSKVSFKCDGEDKWQLVTIPMSQFTYSGTKGFDFPRFDIILSAGSVGENDSFQISEISVLTAPPRAIYEPDAMVLDKTSVVLKQNETEVLTPVFSTVKDGLALSETVTYTSSNTNVVTVSEEGKLRAVGQGNAVITAQSASGLRAECAVTVNGVGEITEYVSFTRSDYADSVTGDPRFKSEIKLPVSSSLKRFNFFTNGKNDRTSVDLSDYIENSKTAVVCFYVKTNYSGKIDTCFFHTKGGIYKDSASVSFTANGSGEWERVCLPLNKFKYTGGGKAEFARFDFVFKAGQLTDGHKLSVSEIRVLSFEPEEYFPAESVSLANGDIKIRVNEYAELNPIFASSKGANVIPGEMEWSTSNPQAVQVDGSGTVLGKGEGSAVITGKMKNGNTVSCTVTVSGTLEITEKARFTVTKYEKTVINDLRYDAIIKYPVSKTTARIQLFRNGKSDSQSYDLSPYIGQTPKSSPAYLYFYVYSPVTGRINLNFFHTKGGVYEATNSVPVTIDKANVWQAVCVPMSEFYYKRGGDLHFGRFDITCAKGTFEDGAVLKVSPVKIVSSRPVIPQLVKAQRITLNEQSRVMPAETAFKLTAEFSADNGNAAAEDITWQSSDGSIATVSEDGYVKTRRVGNVTITARSEESDLFAECRITVTEREASVARWTMDRSYSWATGNLMKAFAKTENDSRFTDYITAVNKNGEDYQFQLYQKGSAIGDISDCVDFGVVRFWIKVPRDNTVFDLSFTSNKGSFYSGSKRYKVKIANSDGWQRVEIPLSELEFSGDFLYSRVKFVSIFSVKEKELKEGESNLAAGDTLKLGGLQVLNHSPSDPQAPNYAPVKSITLDSDYVTMELGARHKITYAVNPQNADQSVTFVNRNTEALTVDASGIVLARASGKYTVSVITDSGHKRADCTIEVKPLPKNAASKCIFEVNFAKGKWNDVKDGSFTSKIKTLKKTDENYYRFKREMSYSVLKADAYYSDVGKRFTMFYGDMVDKTSLSYLRLNAEPYLETATVRFWVKAPRAGIRMMVGFNDHSYATAKYNYTIAKADEWTEVRLPLKDILSANKKINVNELRNIIISAATDLTSGSAAALKEGEEIQFGYFQVWTGKPEDIAYTELDESRYFYDDSDEDIWIVDRNMVLPQLTSVKFMFETKANKLERFSKAVKPCTVGGALDIYAVGMNSGKKYANDSLYKPVEVWIRKTHPAIKNMNPESFGVGVYKNGSIKLIDSSIKDDCYVFEINSYDKLVFLNLTDEVMQIIKSGKRPVFNITGGENNRKGALSLPLTAVICAAAVIAAGGGAFVTVKAVNKNKKGAEK